MSQVPATQPDLTDVLNRIATALAGRYVIARELGRGAMATVYLARDVKHQRDVAVKVLHPDVAAALGADRFLREVDVLAHLHHPHILPLFDSGEVDGCLYYVMPRVEGESLRDRLRRERQLPVEDALQITREVAAALDYAHRRHVVHRDVKPANILLQDGQALVADFGIALAVSAPGERMTGTGLSLGTPWYMSPEQATGTRDLDARSDVYSLGCVLYEMLTGEPPHAGRDPQMVLAQVVSAPVRPVRLLRDTVPLHVEAALHKALARLPADRYASMADFARALATPGERAVVPARPRWPLLAAAVGGWTVAAGALVAAWLAMGGGAAASAERGPIRRWSIVLPDSAPLAFVGSARVGVGRRALAISPDGDRLVYVAQRGSGTQLYLRELDRLDERPLPGTAGASHPFFSPDGAWIGFFVGQELRKVSLRGDQPLTLAALTDPFGATWAPDGRILVAERQGSRLVWVPGTGGTPQPIARQITDRVIGPQLIGTDWVLHGSIDGILYLHHLATGWPYAITQSGLVRRDSAELQDLVIGSNPHWLESGHIAYFSGEGTLMVLPFDLARRRVLGPAVPVLDGIRLESEAGDAQLAVSPDGTLAYAPGPNARVGRFVWVRHGSGAVDTLPLPGAAYSGFDLSPDGRQIVVRARPASGRAELWILDADGTRRTRLPTEGFVRGSPRWWPDGASVMYFEFAARSTGIPISVRHPLQNPGTRDTLPAGAIAPGHDKEHLTVTDRDTFWLVPIGRPGERVRLFSPIVRGGAMEFSPDGRLLAYMDLDDPGAGRGAAYVTPVGRPDVRHALSAVDGEEPRWTPDGRAVIYRDRQEWWAVDVDVSGARGPGRPRLLFRGPYLQVPGMSHAVAADGRRSLVLLGPTGQTTTRLVVVTNWFTELERLSPSKKR